MFDATNIPFMTKPLQRTRPSRYPNQNSVTKDNAVDESPYEQSIKQEIESSSSKDQGQIEAENTSNNRKRTQKIDNNKTSKDDPQPPQGVVKIDVWNQSGHGETTADTEIRLLAKESKMERKQIKPEVFAPNTHSACGLENKSDHGETTADKEFRLLANESKIRKTQTILDDEDGEEDETTADAELRLLANESRTRVSPRKQTIANKNLISAMPIKGTVGSRRSSLASSTPVVQNLLSNDSRARRASMACATGASAAGKISYVASYKKPVTHTSPVLKHIVEEVDAELREKEEGYDDMMSDINKEYQAMLQRKKRRNRALRAQ